MIEKKIKILAISGSTRKQSSNEQVLKLIGIRHAAQIDLSIFDGIDKLPHFNPDYDTEEKLPETIKEFRQQIKDAAGIIFCTPEYVFSMPGALKNAFEWNVSTTLFSGKPVALIIAAAQGDKTFESLQLILSTLEAEIPEGCALLIKGVKGKLSPEGTFNDLGIPVQLDHLVSALIFNIRSLQQ